MILDTNIFLTFIKCLIELEVLYECTMNIHFINVIITKLSQNNCVLQIILILFIYVILILVFFC